MKVSIKLTFYLFPFQDNASSKHRKGKLFQRKQINYKLAYLKHKNLPMPTLLRNSITHPRAYSGTPQPSFRKLNARNNKILISINFADCSTFSGGQTREQHSTATSEVVSANRIWHLRLKTRRQRGCSPAWLSHLPKFGFYMGREFNSPPHPSQRGFSRAALRTEFHSLIVAGGGNVGGFLARGHNKKY